MSKPPRATVCSPKAPLPLRSTYVGIVLVGTAERRFAAGFRPLPPHVRLNAAELVPGGGTKRPGTAASYAAANCLRAGA